MSVKKLVAAWVVWTAATCAIAQALFGGGSTSVRAVEPWQSLPTPAPRKESIFDERTPDGEEMALDHLQEDPHYKALFVKEPDGTNAFTAVTETNYLDHLKNDPNYADLFVKGSGYSQSETLDNSYIDRMASDPNYKDLFTSGDDGKPVLRPNAVTEDNYLDHLQGSKIYDELLKPPDDDDAADDRTIEERASDAVNASAEFLGGDAGSACAAMLCLATGNPPHECDGPLERYFSIKHRRASRTAKARAEFLMLCPMQSDSILKEGISSTPPPRFSTFQRLHAWAAFV